MSGNYVSKTSSTPCGIIDGYPLIESEYVTFDQLREELRKKPDLVEVVRCRDCRHFKKGEEEPPVDWCCYFHDEVTPLGFCAWGTKTDFVTCKCGEDIERIGRIQTCPSCGRKVMA